MKAVSYDLKGVKTAAEALDSAELNWEAQPVNLLTESGIAVPDHRAIVRSDNNGVIGVVGSRYLPIQNSFGFSFFDTVCDQYNAKYDRAYVVDGGHKVILEATVNGAITIRKGDDVFKKIRLINTFDGSSPFMAQFSIWRQICKNGLMGWAKENKCKVHHTKNAECRAAEALRIMSTSVEYFKKFEIQLKQLANKIIDRKQIDQFIKQCMNPKKDAVSTRLKNDIAEVEKLFEAGAGTGQGTGYDIFNSYVEWIDHYRSADAETRLANAIIGSVSMKEHAFEVISNICL